MVTLERLIIHHIILLYCIISVSSNQDCNTAKQCMNQTLNDSAVTQCRGYKAAFGPSTSWSGGKIQCTASFSCSSMQFMRASMKDSAQVIHCKGRDSCSSTIMESNNSKIECYGSNSCSYSNITTTYDADLTCSGYLSCSNAYIHGVELIGAYASLSLFNTTIDTIGTIDNTIHLIIEGSLAAFGAKLICRDTHICYIHCRGFNSCYMFYTECIGECIVNTSTVSSTPITNITQFNTFKPYVPNLFDSEAVEPSNNELCVMQQWNYDDSQEYMNGADITINNEGPMCCRGFDSCYGINEIRFETKTDLMCDGLNSCRSVSSIISNNGTIYCQGQFSCYLSSISHAHDVYCSGRNSCSGDTITDVSYIVCSGQKSCFDSTLISNGFNLNVYFVSRLAGKDATLYCNETDTCNVYCHGLDSCDGTVLYCNGNCDIECDVTDSKCPIVYGSKAPTIYPRQAPSEATDDPTRAPTNNPTSSNAVTTNYEVKIGINCENTDNKKCGIDPDVLNDVIETILSVDADVEIVSTEIVNDDLVIQLSITTGPHNILKQDIISDHIEAAIKDNDDFGDVETDEKDDDFNDIEDDSSVVNNPSMMTVMFLSVGFIFSMCCIAGLCYYIFKVLLKRQLVSLASDVGSTADDVTNISSADRDEPDDPAFVPTIIDNLRELKDLPDEEQKRKEGDKASDLLVHNNNGDDNSSECEAEDELMYDNVNNVTECSVTLQTPCAPRKQLINDEQTIGQVTVGGFEPIFETTENNKDNKDNDDKDNNDKDKVNVGGGSEGF